ncbi:hypothetical protein, conserved [Eimeria necatrix]|uniref:Uncharacterized protein n=1 Tax=Eimeria necatrix TaxID=51315 RepID=U6MLJ7_9EIME|nr:hypothetical protein, conserved [Eimeria necatrix]CDJ63339.1 hypothetical protein, conserved [Eimeria necatrix]
MATKMKRFLAPGPGTAGAAGEEPAYSLNDKSRNSGVPRGDAPRPVMKTTDHKGGLLDVVEDQPQQTAALAPVAAANLAAGELTVTAAREEAEATGLVRNFTVSQEMYGWGGFFSREALKQRSDKPKETTQAMKDSLKLGVRLLPFGLQPCLGVRQVCGSPRHFALVSDTGQIYILVDPVFPWQEAYGGRWHLLPASLHRPFTQVSITSGPLPSDPLAFLNGSTATTATSCRPTNSQNVDGAMLTKEEGTHQHELQQQGCSCCCSLQDPAGYFSLGALDGMGGLWLGSSTACCCTRVFTAMQQHRQHQQVNGSNTLDIGKEDFHWNTDVIGGGRCFCHIDIGTLASAYGTGAVDRSRCCSSSSSNKASKTGQQLQQLHCPLQRELGRLPLQQQSKATENNVPCVFVSLPEEEALVRTVRCNSASSGAVTAPLSPAAPSLAADCAAAATGAASASASPAVQVSSLPAAAAQAAVTAAEGSSIRHAAVFRSRLFPSKFGLVVKGRRQSRLFCPLPDKPVKVLCGPGADSGLLLLAGGQLLQWGLRRSASPCPSQRASSLALTQVRGCLEGRCVVDIALGFRCAAQDGSSAVDAFAVCSSGVVYEFSLGWVANEVVRGPYLRLRPPVPEPIEFTPFCFDLLYGHPNAMNVRLPYSVNNFKRLVQAVPEDELETLVSICGADHCSSGKGSRNSNKSSSSSAFRRFVQSYWLRDAEEELLQPSTAAPSQRAASSERAQATLTMKGPAENSLAAASGSSVAAALQPIKKPAAYVGDFPAASLREQQQQQPSIHGSREAQSHGDAVPTAAANSACSISINNSSNNSSSASSRTATASQLRLGDTSGGIAASSMPDALFAAFMRLREEEINILYNTAGETASGGRISGATAATEGQTSAAGTGNATSCGSEATTAMLTAATSDPLQQVWCCGGYLIFSRASGRLLAASRGTVFSGVLRRRLKDFSTTGSISSTNNSSAELGTFGEAPHSLFDISSHHIKQAMELHRHLGLGICLSEGLAGRAVGLLGPPHGFSPPCEPPPQDELQPLLLRLASATKPPYSVYCGPASLVLSVSAVCRTSTSGCSPSSSGSPSPSSSNSDFQQLLKLGTRTTANPRSVPRSPPVGYLTAASMRHLTEAIWSYCRHVARDAAPVQQVLLQLSREMGDLAQQHDEQLFRLLQQQREQQESTSLTAADARHTIQPGQVRLQQKLQAQLASLLLLLLSRVFLAQRAAPSSDPDLLDLLQQLQQQDDGVPQQAKRRRCAAHAKRATQAKGDRRPPPAETHKLKEEGN